MAIHEERPVPTVASVKVMGSKGTGAMAYPAAAVVTTSAERKKKYKKWTSNKLTF